MKMKSMNVCISYTINLTDVKSTYPYKACAKIFKRDDKETLLLVKCITIELSFCRKR